MAGSYARRRPASHWIDYPSTTYGVVAAADFDAWDGAIYDLKHAFRVTGVAGNVVMAMGDSITANGNHDVGSVTNAYQDATSYLRWASLLSEGRIFYGGVAATGGYRTDEIYSTHLATITAAAPSACIVLGGTNDIGQFGGTITATGETINPATTKRYLTLIYQGLAAEGILPICCTVPPRSSDNGALKSVMTETNAWIARYAQLNGYPLIDFHSLFVDTTSGDYSTASGTMTSDLIHPNGAGARLMGQLLAEKLCGGSLLTAITGYGKPVAGQPGQWLPPARSYMVNNNAVSTGIGLFRSNPLFITDTNADGLADGWTLTSGSAPTYSLATDTKILGKYQGFARGANDVILQPSNSTDVATGDVVLVALRISTTTEALSGSPSVDCRYVTNDGLQDLGISLRGWNYDIPAGSVLTGVVTVPSGMASAHTVLQLRAAGTAGATVKVGQVTVLNMTTLGIT